MPVSFLAMFDAHDEYYQSLVFYLINHAIRPNPDPVEFLTLQFIRAGRPRCHGQILDFFQNPLCVSLGNLPKILPDIRRKLNAV